MEFKEKAKIRVGHWLKHTADHLKEYEQFADELEGAGNIDSAQHIREMAVLTTKSTEYLANALLSLARAS